MLGRQHLSCCCASLCPVPRHVFSYPLNNERILTYLRMMRYGWLAHHTPLLKIPVWWRRAVLPSLPWVVCFLSFFLYTGHGTGAHWKRILDKEGSQRRHADACTLQPGTLQPGGGRVDECSVQVFEGIT